MNLQRTGIPLNCVSVALGVLLGLCQSLFAGNVFITGHDPDFHASQGGNAPGAQNIIIRALNFTRAGYTAPILYVQSNTNNTALGDHTDSEQGLIASGYTAGNTPGNHYVKVNATQFATTNLSAFSALFIPSDHGGSLAGDDLAAVNLRAADIQSYVNAGGGLVALAEDGFRTPAASNPQPANFAFLPFLVSAPALSQSETGYTLTPFGAGLGLTVNDINGNASHNIFTAFGPLNVVDRDASGNVISLAFSGSVPEPASLVLLLVGVIAGLAVTCASRHRKHSTTFRNREPTSPA